MGDDRTGVRVSDATLSDMRRDIEMLKLEFAKMSVREEQTQMVLGQFNTAMERMAATIEEFTQYQTQYGEKLASIAEYSQEIKGAAETIRDARGAIRTGYKVKRLGLWLLGVPVVGGSLYVMYSWLLDHLP